MDSLHLPPTSILGPFPASGAPDSCPLPPQQQEREIKKEGSPKRSASPKDSENNGDIRAKPKQSKSRNGCVTCKGKRLKCDETKPTCTQCAKRGVECGGYKKDFKWRAYEDTQLNSKSTKGVKKSSSSGVSKTKKVPAPLSGSALSTAVFNSVQPQYSPSFTSPQPRDFSYEKSPVPSSADSESFDQDLDFIQTYSLEDSLSPPSFSPRYEEQALQSQVTPPVEYAILNVNGFDSNTLYMSQTPEVPAVQLYPPIHVEPTTFPVEEEDLFDDNSSIRTMTPFDMQRESSWENEGPDTPATTAYSSSPMEPPSPIMALVRPLPLGPADPQNIMWHFNQNTCGVMSIKNGPTNPWRTLIWDLAQSSPALYHAVSAMTSFHMAQRDVSFRVKGVEHVRDSLVSLQQGIGQNTMTDEAAVATTLVLTFAEAFDRHISTGTEHLKGAKILINRALQRFSQAPRDGAQYKRLKFLYNTWLYLDVLAKLTSESDDDNVLDSAFFGPDESVEDIDPLMGVASTLFPLIGKVASLVRRVRNSSVNDITIITEAINLQNQLQHWMPTSTFHSMEDDSTSMVDCINTAEAYKYATLLYLHQAVPDIPSSTSSELAQKVFNHINNVPITSGACIVHMYPLLVAGCEARGQERGWVDSRWEAMTMRMWLGNVGKAWEVVKAVWARRDATEERATSAAAASMRRSRSAYSNPSSRSSSVARSIKGEYLNDSATSTEGTMLFDEFGNPVDPRQRTARPSHYRMSSEGLVDSLVDKFSDVTVKDDSHWVTVMKDKKWEVLLG